MKRLLCLLLSLVMIMSLTVGCGKDNEDATSTPQSQDTSSPTPEPEKVVLKLGIWPEPTLTDDIAVHEGYVERFNELYPNVEVVPAHYKYATDTFVPMAEAGNCPTIFETWFTEPQKLIAGEFIADITDNLKARGWDKAMNPSIRELLSKDGRIYGTPRDGYARNYA